MYKRESISFRVACLRDPGKAYSMRLRKVTSPEGFTLFSPCNGCDFCFDHPACTACKDRVDHWAFTHRQQFFSCPFAFPE